jgi:hypothetical protein
MRFSIAELEDKSFVIHLVVGVDTCSSTLHYIVLYRWFGQSPSIKIASAADDDT